MPRSCGTSVAFVYAANLDPSNRLSRWLSRCRGIALINSIGNLGRFVGLYAVGRIKDATGELSFWRLPVRQGFALIVPLRIYPMALLSG
jgi:hypothetical protein